MPAYWIASVTVTDPDSYAEYAKRATDAIAAHGGEFLARASRSICLEGKMRERNVVVQFPSIEDAERCYNSEQYREALAFAANASERDIIVVEGNPAPAP